MVPYYFDTVGGITGTAGPGQSGAGSAQVSLIAPGGIGLTGFDAGTILEQSGLVVCETAVLTARNTLACSRTRNIRSKSQQVD